MSAPLVVDIGLAVQQLEASPELGDQMMKLVVGEIVAGQLKDAAEAVTDILTGLQAIIDRSNTGDPGTSKVGDMRKLAESLLAKHGGAA